MPQITLPPRVAQESATLTDNILINQYQYKCISGNITSFISDHLPQFTIFENLQENNITKNGIELCSEISRISVWMSLKDIILSGY